MTRPATTKPVWTAVEAPEGYGLAMDTSKPGGMLRYRHLPHGEWRPGNVPTDPSLEDILGPSLRVEGIIDSEAARNFLEDLDRKTGKS